MYTTDPMTFSVISKNEHNIFFFFASLLILSTSYMIGTYKKISIATGTLTLFLWTLDWFLFWVRGQMWLQGTGVYEQVIVWPLIYYPQDSNRHSTYCVTCNYIYFNPYAWEDRDYFSLAFFDRWCTKLSNVDKVAMCVWAMVIGIWIWCDLG